LDSNVLIALITPDHVCHDRARKWFKSVTDFATCPITQGALIRFYFRLADQPAITDAKSLLRQIADRAGHHFWPDDLSYTDLPDRRIIGHRQVTDAYLAALASAHGGMLATMDEGLAAIHSRACILI
jgi:toxin-antitoxin system PIN domain toxin